jgi:hypothetical protein
MIIILSTAIWRFTQIPARKYLYIDIKQRKMKAVLYTAQPISSVAQNSAEKSAVPVVMLVSEYHCRFLYAVG